MNASVFWALQPELWISIGAIGPKVGFFFHSLVITDPTLVLKLSPGHAYPLEDRFRARLQDEYFSGSFFKVIIASRSPGSVNQRRLGEHFQI